MIQRIETSYKQVTFVSYSHPHILPFNPSSSAKATVWFLEKGLKDFDEDKSKFTLLVDLTPPNNGSDMEFQRIFSKIFQAVYAERVYQIICHPTSVFFYSVWNIIKLFIDPVTAAKVKPIVYFYAVQELIDDEYIPQSMVRYLRDI